MTTDIILVAGVYKPLGAWSSGTQGGFLAHVHRLWDLSSCECKHVYEHLCYQGMIIWHFCCWWMCGFNYFFHYIIYSSCPSACNDILVFIHILVPYIFAFNNVCKNSFNSTLIMFFICLTENSDLAWSFITYILFCRPTACVSRRRPLVLGGGTVNLCGCVRDCRSMICSCKYICLFALFFFSLHYCHCCPFQMWVSVESCLNFLPGTHSSISPVSSRWINGCRGFSSFSRRELLQSHFIYFWEPRFKIDHFPFSNHTFDISMFLAVLIERMMNHLIID